MRPGLRVAEAGRSYTLLAEIFVRMDEHERAQELLELAIEILAPQGPSRHLVRAYRRLASVLKAKAISKERSPCSSARSTSGSTRSAPRLRRTRS